MPRKPKAPRGPYTGARRAEAARKGWETRRRNEAEREIVTFKIPGGNFDVDKRDAGDAAFDVYRQLTRNNDLAGDARAAFKGLEGQRVLLQINGYSFNEDEATGAVVFRRFQLRRKLSRFEYDETFGKQGAFIHAVRAEAGNRTPDGLAVVSITIREE